MLEIIKTAFAPQATLQPPSSAVRKTMALLEQELAAGGALVTEFDQHVVACVLHQPRHDALYFHRLAVLPALHGRGIGRALINTVEQLARTSGSARVELSVRLELDQQRRFYESLGYQTIGYGSHADFDQPTYATMQKLV